MGTCGDLRGPAGTCGDLRGFDSGFPQVMETRKVGECQGKSGKLVLPQERKCRIDSISFYFNCKAHVFLSLCKQSARNRERCKKYLISYMLSRLILFI